MPRRRSSSALMPLAERGRKLAERLVALQVEQDQTGNKMERQINEILHSLRRELEHESPLEAFALGCGFMCAALRADLPSRTGWEGLTFEELPDLFDPLAWSRT